MDDFIIKNTINKLQKELSEKTLLDYYIIRLDKSGKLLLAGSFDFCYYHDVEILFYEVSFMCFPTTSFSMSCCRIAEENEITNLSKVHDIDKDGYVIAFDDAIKKATYFIVAERIDYNFQIVKYYDNENKIIRGEVISDWARERIYN